MPTGTATPDPVPVERSPAAPPDAVFALLVDPSRHRDIDGSGTVRDVKGESSRLTLGSVFGIWGLALALPLMAIIKVMIDHFRTEGDMPETTAA